MLIQSFTFSETQNSPSRAALADLISGNILHNYTASGISVNDVGGHRVLSAFVADVEQPRGAATFESEDKIEMLPYCRALAVTRRQ